MSLIRVFLGRTKSGKSYKTEQLLKSLSKVIVYDYARCFSGKSYEDFSPKNFAKLLKMHGGAENKNKKFKLIFRKPFDMLHEDAVDQLALFVSYLGRSYGNRTLPENDLLTFVIDEADKCTTRKSNDKVRRAVQAGRHENISTWAIAQRPMNLHPDFRDNATEIFAFKCGNNPYYRDTFGKLAVSELNHAPEFSFLHWTDTGTMDLVLKNGRKKDVSTI